jgi:hypothetical protein
MPFWSKKKPESDLPRIDLDATDSQPAPAQPAVVPDEELDWYMNGWRDYSRLPELPATPISENAMGVYKLMKEMYDEAAAEVDREIHENRALYGSEVTAEQRDVLIGQRVRENEIISDAARSRVDAEFEQEYQREQQENKRHEQLVEAIERASPYAEAKKFVKEHPFLTGVLGAEIVDRLSKKR